MKITAILPVYNCEDYLAQAIDSILQQTRRVDEIIIVDDGSTDASLEIAERYASERPDLFRVIQQANQGVAHARNRALELARYPILAFLDADDLWLPHKIEIQMGLLEAHAHIHVVTGLSCRVFLTDQKVFTDPGDPEFHLVFSAALMRLELFERYGLLDESLRQAEDTDWFLRLWENDETYLWHPEVVLILRRHGKNLTKDRERELPALLLKTMHRSIARRKKSGRKPSRPMYEFFTREATHE